MTGVAPQLELDPRVLGHAQMVMNAMLVNGLVVPLLGAGVNLFDRPSDARWRVGEFLPDGRELASHLAKMVPEYPPAMLEDLLRASQCVDLKLGWKALYLTLHDLLDADYPPTDLHHLLARVPKLMATLDRPPREPHLLYVSTNYDDVLERALDEAEEPYDLVWYVARGDNVGKFMHKPPGGEPRVIPDPSEYVEPLDLTERSVVLKIHGAVDRATSSNGDNGELDSYMITEDNYIEYLTRIEIRKLIPKGLVAKLRNSSILFLGYSLRDWNLRAIFHRIWQEEKLGLRSWAIRRPLDPLPADAASDPAAQEQRRRTLLERELDEAFWDQRGVDIFDADLRAYTRALAVAASGLADEHGRR